MAAGRDLAILGGRVIVPAKLFSVRFSRSGGPGGQNVNKVESKVDLRLDLAGLVGLLSEMQLARINQQLENRLDEAGQLQIVASEHRDQIRNLDAAYARTAMLLNQALVIPKTRRKTKPSYGSVQRRLTDKKRQSERKQSRGNRSFDE